MRVKRRATLTTLAVVALLAASVGTATAKRDKPKPASAAPIAVSMEAVPLWVHEDADRIRYTVTLENKTSDALTGVSVEFTAAGLMDDPRIVEIPANGSTAVGFERYVRQFSQAADCKDGANCPLPARVEVLVDGAVTRAKISTPLMPDPSCEFEIDAVRDEEEAWIVEGSAFQGLDPVDDLCIWTLPAWDADWYELEGWDLGDTMTGTITGVWEITLTPIPPTNKKRPISATVTVRDGVPGNWCTRWIGTPSLIGGTWKWNPDPEIDNDIVGDVYLPGVHDPSDPDLEGLEEGMCLGVGRTGGDISDYFEIGNPKSFYLRADGYVTVRWVSELPGPPPE